MTASRSTDGEIDTSGFIQLAANLKCGAGVVLSFIVYELFGWLQKRFCPPSATITALEAIPSSSSKKELNSTMTTPQPTLKQGVYEEMLCFWISSKIAHCDFIEFLLKLKIHN